MKSSTSFSTPESRAALEQLKEFVRAGIAAGEPRIIRGSRDRSSLAIRRQDEKRAPQSCRQEHWRERILSVVQERPAILAWRMTLTTSFRRPLVVQGREAARLGGGYRAADTCGCAINAPQEYLAAPRTRGCHRLRCRPAAPQKNSPPYPNRRPDQPARKT